MVAADTSRSRARRRDPARVGDDAGRGAAHRGNRRAVRRRAPGRAADPLRLARRVHPRGRLLQRHDAGLSLQALAVVLVRVLVALVVFIVVVVAHGVLLLLRIRWGVPVLVVDRSVLARADADVHPPRAVVVRAVPPRELALALRLLGGVRAPPPPCLPRLASADPRAPPSPRRR